MKKVKNEKINFEKIKIENKKIKIDFFKIEKQKMKWKIENKK